MNPENRNKEENNSGRRRSMQAYNNHLDLLQVLRRKALTTRSGFSVEGPSINFCVRDIVPHRGVTRLHWMDQKRN